MKFAQKEQLALYEYIKSIANVASPNEQFRLKNCPIWFGQEAQYEAAKLKSPNLSHYAEI